LLFSSNLKKKQELLWMISLKSIHMISSINWWWILLKIFGGVEKNTN